MMCLWTRHSSCHMKTPKNYTTYPSKKYVLCVVMLKDLTLTFEILFKPMHLPSRIKLSDCRHSWWQNLCLGWNFGQAICQRWGYDNPMVCENWSVLLHWYVYKQLLSKGHHWQWSHRKYDGTCHSLICLGVKIMDTSQSTKQIDGSSSLKIVGESRFTWEIIVKDVDTKILGRVWSMQRNHITIKHARSEVWIEDT